MNKIKCGVIGATGYAGAELVRLLASHPYAEIAAVSSTSAEGQALESIYPNLKGLNLPILENADSLIETCDVVFASLPHGLAEELAVKCLKKGALLIDLSADFRLDDASVYTKWYKKEFNHPDLHEKSVYALPELSREAIKKAEIIGNPGCYPTTIALGLMPALKNGLTNDEHIVIDSKSGVTGAGRGLTQGTHYPDTNEAFSAYKAGAHRHTPEIEQTLSRIAGREVKVTFVPHLLPVNRGIESSIYFTLADGVTFEQVRAAYEEAYKDESFVRVEPDGAYANVKNVRMSNFCDISLHFDAHANTVIVCSCIDNMVKGAAGQAIQNMNIKFGLEETAGLTAYPPAF
ncbi:MAG: N-acetyl-gamma-glutamyl-phosphate reductase [Ruminococcaceae bacterium]|nr:N-acetyl-gamma-glutamyl-phosphate reductase [Oscillospiraceae bacterium]